MAWLNHNAARGRGDVTPEDLSPADRVLAQAALTRVYLGRLQRLEWDRQFLRDRVTGLVRPRIYSLRKLERPMGERALEAPDLAVGTPERTA